MSLVPRMFDFEDPFPLMERDLFHAPDVIEPFKQLMPQNFFAPDFFRPPWLNVFRRWEDYMRPMEELTLAMNKMLVNENAKVCSDDEKFQVIVDVQHFSPEEVKVKVIDGYVVVEGNHEEKRDEHGYISRRFVRRYALPQGCLPDTVESKLSSDGVLTITAPRVLALPSTGEKIIPIQHTGPVSKQPGDPIME